MKLLLTIIMSTVVSASAFAACSMSSVQECTTKATCEGLSKADGVKFTFNSDTKKCMAADTSVATNCLQVSDSTMGKSTQQGGASGSDGKATGSR